LAASSPITKDSITDRVRQVLLERILSGVYPPGFRLVELQIAREFNTSQAPVREALRELEASRLVETEPYRGTRVRDIDERETREAYQVRAVLEHLAAGLAAERLRERIGELRAAADATFDAASRGDIEEYLARNAAFHHMIVTASDNTVLQRTWESLGFAIGSHARRFPGRMNLIAAARKHQEIVDALERGDAHAAATMLRAHAESFTPSQMAAPAAEISAPPVPRSPIQAAPRPKFRRAAKD
jgi:DNA-binding GntR family transcriptional regulator